MGFFFGGGGVNTYGSESCDIEGKEYIYIEGENVQQLTSSIRENINEPNLSGA